MHHGCDGEEHLSKTPCSYSREPPCCKMVGRNTWARLPAATQGNHPAARWCGGQNIPKQRSYKMLLQAKRESLYRLLNDKSVPTATPLLLDAVHCNSRDPSSHLLIDLIWLQGDSLTVCKKHTQYSEWSRWCIKLESVLGRQRLHYSEDIEKQSTKHKDNSVNGEPFYKTKHWYLKCTVPGLAVSQVQYAKLSSHVWCGV